MPSELITNLNWVDLLIVISIIRIIYIGVKQGLLTEFYKLLGVLLGIVFALHYYIGLSNFIDSHSLLTAGFTEPASFYLLFVVIVVIFKFIREVMAVVIRVEPIPVLNSVGSFLLGILRAWIFASILIFGLLVIRLDYVKNSVKQSYLGHYLVNTAPAIYSYSFENILSKFFSAEKINQAVFETTNFNKGPEKKQQRPR